MDIFLVRHAESATDSQGIYQEQKFNSELSETGKQQVQTLTKALSKLAINQIFTSPAQCCMQSSVAVAQGLLLPIPITDQRLRGINYGLWAGKTKIQIQQENPQDWELWQTDPQTLTFPEGENISQLLERSLEFLHYLTQYDLQRVVVVTHDTIIRVLLTKLLMREFIDLWIYDLDAGGYSVIEWNGKFKQVVKINANDHLEGITSDLSTYAL